MIQLKNFKIPVPSQLILLALLVIISFIPLIYNGFVSWDDEIYIVNNALIQSLNTEKFSHIFSSSFEGHYHPFTLLSLSMDYRFFGLNPLAFHLHNLLLHLLNSFLVYLIIRKISKNNLIAWLTAVFFGIHPMHVEAVAWATARKDVLYSLYFLLSILFYLLYKEKNKKYWYVFSLLAFVFSVLSKGQAVFLPLCLIIFSYFRGKSLHSPENYKDKIPYLALALVFGIVAFFAQQKTGYMGEYSTLPSWWKVILTAALSLWIYIYKLILPISLSAYYPVPDLKDSSVLLAGTLCLILSIGLVYLLYRGYNAQRLIVSGILFFLVNIFIFLRWIPVSNYIIADRYTYISSIGLFFIAGSGFNYLYQHKTFKIISISLIIIILTGYSSLSFARIKVWKDSFTLVDDILKKHPDVYPALNSRGNERLEKGDVAGALEDFNHAIKVQAQHSRGWANRGSLYFSQGKPAEALKDLNEAVAVDPNNPRILNNRGLIYDALGKTNEALADFNAAIQADPYFAEAYNNRGKEYGRTGKVDEAIIDFNRALELNPNLIKAYANRGKARNQKADFKGAVEDFQTAIENGFINKIVYFDLGFSWYNLKDFYKARVNFDKALELSPDYIDAITYRGYTQFNDGDFVSALKDLDKAISLDTSNPIAYGMRGMSLVRLNRMNEACNDFARAEAMGLTQVKKEREKYCK